MTHQLRFAARSDRGLLRSNNQDSVYAGERLLIVADGMGGHAAGDLASRLVVAAFAPLDAVTPPDDLLVPLRDALHEGNDAIAELVADQPELDGMGTTATAMLFDGDRMGLAHIGDSRAYLYRNGVLHQLSHDDTFVQSLVDDGRITEDEAAHHPQRNLLLRALNGTEPEPMLSIREISTGDRFLICSDGLSSVVAAEAIADALSDPEPDSAADRLIELALVAGGPDNVTVIVADVIDVGARSSAPVPGGPVDPEATGPIRPIHATQRMPRVPLPGIPEDVPARPEYVSGRRNSGNRGDDDGGRTDDDDLVDFDDYADDYDDEDDDYPDGADHPGTERIVVGPTAADRKKRRRRAVALIAAVLLMLAVATTGSLIWTRSQYYVGVSADTVVVYRGVSGSVFGISLASVQEDSCAGGQAGCVPLTVNDLVPADRDKVTDGIAATDLAGARGVMSRLQLLPICGSQGGSGTSGGTTTGTGTGTGTGGSSTATSTDRSTGTASSSAAGSSTPPTSSTPGSRSGPATSGPPTTRRPATGTAPTRTKPAATTTPKASTSVRARTSTAPSRPPRTTTVPPKSLASIGRLTSRPGDRLQRGQFNSEAAAPVPVSASSPATASAAAPSSQPSSQPSSESSSAAPSSEAESSSVPTSSGTPSADAASNCREVG